MNLMSCFLFAVNVLHILALDNADFDNQDIEPEYLKGLPGRDTQFVTDYLQFLEWKNLPEFPVVAVTCIIIGLTGNALFCFYFRDKSTRVYHTRDALYIRRISLVDVLICTIVIPYAILFEAKMIKDVVLCKMMEYLRHFLVYLSHILLVSYSREFNLKDRYQVVKERLNWSTKMTVLFSLVVATPSMLLFDVGRGMDFGELLRQNASLAESVLKFPVKESSIRLSSKSDESLKLSDRYFFFKPNFCHLDFNFETKKNTYVFIKRVKTIYIILNGFLLFICIMTLMYHLIKYMDERPLLGANSAFVKVVEAKNPEISERLQRLLSIQEERKRQQRISRLSQELLKTSFVPARYSPGDHNKTNEQPADKGNHNSSQGQDSKITGTGASGKTSRRSSKTTSRRSSDQELAHKISEKLKALSSETAADQGLSRESFNQIWPDIDGQGQNSISKFLEPQVSDETISLVECLCCCEMFKAHPRRMRKLTGKRKRYLVHRTYKTALMWLMIMDMLMICVTIVAFLISRERSVMLNFIHFKSVFGFYILSLFRTELKSAVWGKRCVGGDITSGTDITEGTTTGLS